MKHPRRPFLGSVLAVGLCGVSVASGVEVDFGNDILPLLSDSCFECHGPDAAERKAGLRLDQHEGALALLDSGERGVVPGKSAESAILQRMLSGDPDEVMPPPETGKRLTPEQIAKVRAWIDAGAEWEGHWAFETPTKPAVPPTEPQWRTANAIDHFIQQRLEAEGLTFEAEADKATLIRRVTLDLTGLPPTVEAVEAFLADPSEDAYEQVVERLLRSKPYGEHMARIWLDAARYADTHGLHLDNERSIWPYRDWVIASFNRNQPFDEFTVEQLAGDLLPEPTLEQRVATGFNRCNVTTSEGGSIDEEYYVRYAVDRVETTSTVWLGLTAGCAACHDHKFDPLSQKEFYQLFSYFYSLTEKAMDGNVLLPPPSVKVPSSEQKAKQVALQAELTEVEKAIGALASSVTYRDPAEGETLPALERKDRVWVDDALPEGATGAGDEGSASWAWGTSEDGHPVKQGERSTVRTAEGLSQHYFTDAQAPLLIGENDQLFAHVYLDPQNPPQTVQLQFNDGSWDHRAYWGADKGHGAGRNDASNRSMGALPESGRWIRLEVSAEAVGLKPGSRVQGLAFTQYGGTVYWDAAGVVALSGLSEAQLASQGLWEQYRARVKSPGLPQPVQDALQVEADQRSDEQRGVVKDYFLREVHPEIKERFAGPIKRERDLKEALAALDKAIPATLVMEEREQPRQAHILERGEYTEKREPVSSAVPEWIAPTLDGAPPNRLGLAQWLVSPKHPLTARVTVNRFWQQFFGTGLVKTSEDFGVQGERPSHPELLDWLALDFIDSGWDVKRFLKQLVMSASYRQSSRVTPEKLALDPENRWLARGPRFRLDAEVIRDQALTISGLLVERAGGPSVKPYQPEGLWKPVGFGGSNTAIFTQDLGDKLYRRSMYTFWKRTAPPPSMATFDAPNRETCTVRRARTNTPLQALVLMNDVQFMEAARKFAERVMREGGEDLEARIDFAFQSVLARKPSATERSRVGGLFEEKRALFQKDESAVEALLKVGESSRDASLDGAGLAAWTMVTHLLFNLSETVTRS